MGGKCPGEGVLTPQMAFLGTTAAPEGMLTLKPGTDERKIAKTPEHRNTKTGSTKLPKPRYRKNANAGFLSLELRKTRTSWITHQNRIMIMYLL